MTTATAGVLSSASVNGATAPGSGKRRLTVFSVSEVLIERRAVPSTVMPMS